MIRFQFVDDDRDIHGVKRVCEVLGIQRSSYYKWRDSCKDRADRQAADDALAARIADIHHDWDRRYGYRRIAVELATDPAVDGPVSHKRIARLMRENNIVGIHLRKPHVADVRTMPIWLVSALGTGGLKAETSA